MSEEVIILTPKRNTVVVDDDRVEQLESATIQTDFSADKTQIVQGEQIQFTDLSSLSPTEWHWDFGDGTYSTEQHPTKTYVVGGTYTVKLQAGSVGDDPADKGSVAEKQITVEGIGQTNPVFLYSLRLVNIAHTGPIVRLRDGSTNEERDFYGDPRVGTLDHEELFAWTNNNVHIVTLYDQSGNGNDATETAESRQWELRLGNFNGHPFAWFYANDGGFDGAYQMSNAVSFPSGAHTADVVGSSRNTPDSYLGEGRKRYVWPEVDFLKYSPGSGTSGSANVSVSLAAQEVGKFLIYRDDNASPDNVFFYFNGSYAGSDEWSSGTQGISHIIAEIGNFGLMRWGEIVGWDRILSSSEIDKVHEDQKAWWGL